MCVGGGSGGNGRYGAGHGGAKVDAQAAVGLAFVGLFGASGGVAVDGPVHLVLHGSEKLLRGLGAGIVINAGGVDFEDLAPELFFRGPDVADAGEEEIEVVAGFALLELIVVEDKALDEVVAELLGGPDAELDAAMRFYPVADGDDDIEGVVLDLVGFAVGGSPAESQTVSPARRTSMRVCPSSVWKRMISPGSFMGLGVG